MNPSPPTSSRSPEQTHGDLIDALPILLRAFDAEPAEDHGHTLANAPDGTNSVPPVTPRSPRLRREARRFWGGTGTDCCPGKGVLLHLALDAHHAVRWEEVVELSDEGRPRPWRAGRDSNCARSPATPSSPDTSTTARAWSQCPAATRKSPTASSRCIRQY